MSSMNPSRRTIHIFSLLVILAAGANALIAQEMSTEIYGNQELGKETTVKQSLDDPDFKLRKLAKDHPLYFEQPQASAEQVAAMKALKAKQWTVPITAMEMKLIPPGEFVMGSPENERYRRKDEVQHKVKISKPFYMGAFEVTQRQFYYLTIPDYDFVSWKRVTGPLHVGAALYYRDLKKSQLQTDNPMESLSWITAIKYCKRLTEFERQAGRLPEGYQYRLPTEAEWEYACRAGTKSYFNTDADLDTLIKDNSTGKFAFLHGYWTGKINKERTPNAWGLRDMHGNVYEFTLDTYAPYKTDKGVRVDPVNFENEPNQDVFVNEKVIRGGCFLMHLPHYHYESLRSAARNSLPHDFDFDNITGMRIVLAPKIDVPMPEAKAATKK